MGDITLNLNPSYLVPYLSADTDKTTNLVFAKGHNV
jgi:hypothetical protein